MADIHLPDWVAQLGVVAAAVAERLYRVAKSRDKLARRIEELVESLEGVYRRLGRLETKVDFHNTTPPYGPEPLTLPGKKPGEKP